MPTLHILARISALSPLIAAACAWSQPLTAAQLDSDQDGLPDAIDPCPGVVYNAGFRWDACAPMNLDPRDDPEPVCKARERVAAYMLEDGAFITHIAFAVVIDGQLHFADGFEYLGQGQIARDPAGVHRLFRIGSTTKPIVAVAAKVLEEEGVLTLDDGVNPTDASQELNNPQRRLRHLLSHQGAFKLDNGAVHLFCYPGDLAAFWQEPNDLISPHYDSPTYGNLGGGYQYSAFNYSLAGAYLANRTAMPFAEVIQTRVFNSAGMCTAMLDGERAASSPFGANPGYSQGASMHLGPYINLVSPDDPLCEDNFYNSDDVYGDDYDWQAYYLNEAAAEARDPAGGVIATVLDLAHFAEALLASYHGPNGLISQDGVKELWTATHDLGCGGGCPYHPYYATGFFTDTPPGRPVTQVGHGGSRAGFASAFVLRPEANMAVCILANADANTVAMSDLAKTILDDFAQ